MSAYRKSSSLLQPPLPKHEPSSASLGMLPFSGPVGTPLQTSYYKTRQYMQTKKQDYELLREQDLNRDSETHLRLVTQRQILPPLERRGNGYVEAR